MNRSHVSSRTAATITVAGAAAAAAAAVGLLGAPAGAADRFGDAAYGIRASGAATIAATPAVSSTDGQPRTASGGARTSDGTVSLTSATVRAGGGTASIQANGFTAFGGLVAASSVHVDCDHGAVTASVQGTPAGPVGRKGRVDYGVQTRNSDGTTTIVGMRISIQNSPNTAVEVIDVASATCGNPTGGGTPTPAPTTTAPTGRPTTPGPTRTGPSPTGGARPSPSRSVPAAPPPSPGTGHLPVTG